jgi:SagB-type dehydrogenase family enzyme
VVKTIEAPLKLPPPNHQGRMTVEEATSKRRSIRRFRTQPLSLMQLSQILWSAQGITGTGGRRAAPSAGATYPLEIFIVIGEHGVENLASGIYHYDVDSHSLSLHLMGDLRQKIAEVALSQSFIANCPVDIVICALYTRTAYRYGRRGERYVHMEVGHVGQSISLQAVALGLATVMVGAFEDNELRRILKIEEQIKPLYIIPLGKPV